jgi:hypothetical protein
MKNDGFKSTTILKRGERKNKLLFYFFLFPINFIIPQLLQIVSITPSFNQITSNEHPEILVGFNIPIEPASFDEISFSVF